MKNFALIGAAGYIAPRHMKAIKETDNQLVCAFDPNDSVGVIDSFFPKAEFFVEFERFDRHIDKLRRLGKKIDFVSIASPNYLHDAHIRFALRSEAHAICEKPIVLNPWNVDALMEIEEESKKKIYTILQLRLHPSIVALKEKITSELKADPNRVYEIDLTYLTSRGNWFSVSWKGDKNKSGGIASNIGVHFFDMLSWIFGEVEENICHTKMNDTNAGFLRLKHAKVRWFLSVNDEYLPEEVKQRGQRTYRSIQIDGKEIEFSDGFTDLHTESYKMILKGQGFGINEARDSIKIVSEIRNLRPIGFSQESHPFVKKVRNNE